MGERVSTAARLARGVLGVALSGAAQRTGSHELKAAAELVLSGGVVRKGAAAATSAHASRATSPTASAVDGAMSSTTATPFRAPPSLSTAAAAAPTASSASSSSSQKTEDRPLTKTSTVTPTPPAGPGGDDATAATTTTATSVDPGSAVDPSARPTLSSSTTSTTSDIASSDAQHASQPTPSSTTSSSSTSSAAAMEGAKDERVTSTLHSVSAKKKKLEKRTVAVPASPIARIFGFGQLAAGLAAGTISESARRAWNGNGRGEAATAAGGNNEKNQSGSREGNINDDSPLIGGGGSVFMTEANAERLAVALCRMRGAALKLGQMLSIQDESVIPPQIQRALERVREGADTMPPGQLHKAIEDELGTGWRDKLVDFDEVPLAAASIGQVHRAVYDTRRSTKNTGSGAVGVSVSGDGDGKVDVCMKIQYPGVARSINSDIDNLMRLVSLTDLLPRGLYVEHAVKVAKEELTLECDYEYERESQMRMKALLADDPHWNVPDVVEELCSKGVLTTTFAPGVAIDKAAELPQEERDYIGTQLLRITLRELFEFRFMQTDPNFANFLYDSPTRQLTLIDFGAAKDFNKQFVDDYLRMVVACAEKDRQGLVDASVALGFLTGEEAGVLIDAHCEAGYQVGKPFAAEGTYDFAANRDMTRRVAGLGKVMLKHRLTPPPQEAYSLHRKLSGAFLACMRIGARVPARQMLQDVYENYVFGPEEQDEEEDKIAAAA